jgi:hypothetical protein
MTHSGHAAICYSITSSAVARSAVGILTPIVLGRVLQARIPALAGAASTWVAGIWPAVNPSPAVIKALSRPELAAMQPAFGRDFTRLLSVLVKGL